MAMATLSRSRPTSTGVKELGAEVSFDIFHNRAVLKGLKGFDTLDDKAMVRLRLLIDEKFSFFQIKRSSAM